jgi:glutamate-1-semialdehyde aminotransferase
VLALLFILAVYSALQLAYAFLFTRKYGKFVRSLIPIVAARAFLEVASRPDFYPHLLGLSDRLYAGLREIIARVGLKARVQAAGARFGILFGIEEGPAGEVQNYRQTLARDREQEASFYRAALRHGVFVLGYHHGLSAAYSEADVDELLSRLEGAFADVAAGR